MRYEYERMLIGRDRELLALDELLRRAELGDRAVALVTGEPGIGKTRLLDALAARVVALGGHVAWGRTSEVGVTPAFWPWMQILAALETDADRAPLLGSLELAGGPTPAPTSSTRLARFAEVAAFLARRAAAPIALLFDDAHAADRASLQLLEFVLPLLAGNRVLVAVAARDGDASPEIAAALGRLARNARRIQLGRLSRAEVDALVGGRADAERVFALSEGNPLFVEELVASFEAEGVPRLPQLSSVRAVIRERVAGLPAPTAAALVAAAVVGREFSDPIVSDMLDILRLGPVVAPALQLGIVEMTAPEYYRFSHALVAEAIADELEPSERARLHLRAAQACERHQPSNASAIAHHLLSAGQLAADVAVAAAERAARDANSRLAFEDAAEFLDRALAALQLAAPNDRRRCAQVLCARAEALQHAGDHVRARAVCDEAAGIARELEDGVLFAQIAVVRGLEFRFGTVDPSLVELLRETLERLPATPSALRARALARYAAALQPADDPAEPVAIARESIAMARTHADERDRLAALYVATTALIDYATPAELEPLHAEVLELARRAGDRMIVVHTLLRRCFVAVERLDRPAFAREAAAFGALAGELGVPRWTRLVPMLDAMSALLDGRFDDAARAQTAARRPILDDHAALLLHFHELIAASTRTSPAHPMNEELLAALGASRWAAFAWICAEQGRLDEARGHLARAGDTPLRDPNLAAMATSAIVALRDDRLAATYYERLRARAGEIVVATMVGFAVQDLFDRMLLGLASVCRRWDVIDEHAERALAIAARLSSPVWTARVQADWADALARRGRSGDGERAHGLWTEALATGRRLAMPGLVARCEAALAGPSRASAPSARPPSGPRVSVDQRGELWIVRGLGEEIHVKDSRGMRMLAQLVGQPGVALHALELAGATQGADLGDAGPALDATAKAAYRTRIAELAEERDRAEAWGDVGRATRASEELETLTAELSRALGLGGRDRKIGAAAERARTNVQRRLQHALQQVRAGSPVLAQHLERAISTGMTCVYDPG